MNKFLSIATMAVVIPFFLHAMDGQGTTGERVLYGRPYNACFINNRDVAIASLNSRGQMWMKTFTSQQERAENKGTEQRRFFSDNEKLGIPFAVGRIDEQGTIFCGLSSGAIVVNVQEQSVLLNAQSTSKEGKGPRYFFGGHSQVAVLLTGEGIFERWGVKPGINFLAVSARGRECVAPGADVAACCLTQEKPLIALGFNESGSRRILLYQGSEKKHELAAKATIAALLCARNNASSVVALYSDNSMQIIQSASGEVLFESDLLPSPMGTFVRPCEVSDDGSKLVYTARQVEPKNSARDTLQHRGDDLGIGVLSLDKKDLSSFYPLDTCGIITTMKLSPDGNQLVTIDSVHAVSKHIIPQEMES